MNSCSLSHRLSIEIQSSNLVVGVWYLSQSHTYSPDQGSGVHRYSAKEVTASQVRNPIQLSSKQLFTPPTNSTVTMWGKKKKKKTVASHDLKLFRAMEIRFSACLCAEYINGEWRGQDQQLGIYILPLCCFRISHIFYTTCNTHLQ